MADNFVNDSLFVERIRRITGMLVMLTGCIAIVGWWTNHEALAHLIPGIAGMTFNTALCFVLISALVSFPSTIKKPFHAAPTALAGFVAVFASLSLLQDLFGLNFGIDNLFVFQFAAYPESPYPGRMSPNTSLAFLMSSASLLLLQGSRLTLKDIAIQLLLLLTATLSLTGLIMHQLFPSAPSGLIHFSSMSPFTAISFLLLSVGLWHIGRQDREGRSRKRSPFAPAIHLMQMLTFPQKFTLISLLLLLPMGLTLYELASDTDRELASIERELTGLHYIQGVAALFEAIPQHRGMRNALLHGDASFRQPSQHKQAEIDLLIAKMDALNADIGATLQSHTQWHKIKLAWLQIESNVKTTTASKQSEANAQQSWNRHSKLISGLIALMLHVGERSDILIDPHGETHYLMTAFLEELPTGLELLGQARGLGAGVSATGSLNVNQRFQLTNLSGQIKALFDRVKLDLKRAFKRDAGTAFQLSLNQMRQQQDADLLHFLHLLDDDIIKAQRMDIQPMAYFNAGTQAIGSGLNIFHATSEHFGQMLQTRHEHLSGRKYMLQFSALITLILVIYLLVAFYMAVMRTVNRLGDASQRMLAGDMETVVAVDSRDELGRVVNSFNEVASALIASSANLKAVVNFAVDGIITIDKTGIIQSFNPAAESIFGYQCDEAVGQNVKMLMPESWQAAHDAGMRRYLDTHQANVIGRDVEMEGRRKDGTVFPIDLAINSMQVGDVELFLGVIRDISERKRTEMERERLAAAVEQADDAIVITDTRGNIVFVNPAFERLNGYSLDEVLGENPRILKSNKQDGEFYTRLWQSISSGKTWKSELINQRKDGTLYEAEHIIAPIRNDQGIIVNYLGVQHDISERKQTERELKSYRENLEEMVETRTAELAEVNRELESFSYSVSHDLRAPLRAIDGFSEALMEDYSDKLDAEGHDYLQRVRSGCQRMGDLIEDMLKLSRVTRYEINRSDVDLSALAQLVADQLLASEPQRHISVVIEAGVTARCDAHLLHIVLENLINNAWKYTGKHDQARIEFGTIREQGEIIYFVRDDGAGFDMAYADKLFNAFSRLHASNEFQGTGMGLATVARIIARHGGHIRAEAAVEKGATFYFTLGVCRT